MTKLYTVESFSTYAGIKIEKGRSFDFISLKEQSSNPEDIIILDTSHKPKTEIRRLGMIRPEVVINGIFVKDKNLIKISRAMDKSGGKIILTRAKKFKILKGFAEFILVPKKEHDFSLIRISRYTTLELEISISGNKKHKKIIAYKDLKI